MWPYLIWNLVKRRKEMICPEHFTLPAMSLTERLLSIGQPVSKSSLQYMPLNFQQITRIFSFQKVNKSLVHGGFS